VKIAYSYSRVSSVEQIKGGGLERQIQMAKDYCQRHGYVLDESTTFAEKGKSAFKGSNADTGKLGVILKLISSGAIPRGSVLLVENLDRLARSEATEAMALFLQIINAGITVVTLVDDKTYNKEAISGDPTSLLISLIYFIRANDESKQKQARITDAWRRQRLENIKRGIKDKHNLPKWLRLEGNTFAPVQDKVATVRHVFDLFTKNNLGVNSVATHLNKKGVPTLTGRKWTACTVKFLLKNRALIGEYHVGERVTRNVKKMTGIVFKDYYIARIKVFFAGTEEQKGRYLEKSKGKSGGYINKVIRPEMQGKQFLEVYFNAPWEDRGWRVMSGWNTLPKEEFEHYRIVTFTSTIRVEHAKHLAVISRRTLR
jgi:DNA invertase Pin-like site-specific DNA recombinase